MKNLPAGMRTSFMSMEFVVTSRGGVFVAASGESSLDGSSVWPEGAKHQNQTAGRPNRSSATRQTNATRQVRADRGRNRAPAIGCVDRTLTAGDSAALPLASIAGTRA